MVELAVKHSEVKNPKHQLGYPFWITLEKVLVQGVCVWERGGEVIFT